MNIIEKLTAILLIVLIAGLGIFGLSCAGSTNANSASVQTPNAPAENPVSTPGAAADKVPPSLAAAGELGENIYDAVKVGNWKTAHAKLTELKASAEKISALKIGSADFAATVTKLESAVAANDKTGTLVSANLITLEAANLTAKYNPLVPVEVVKLDFYGRELEIWSQAKDEAKLLETAKMIRRNWDAVKGKIDAKGGKKAVAVFEALVVKTDAAKTPAEFAKLATPILNEVDNLEKVFG
jgi:hypothetical protein